MTNTEIHSFFYSWMNNLEDIYNSSRAHWETLLSHFIRCILTIFNF